MHDTPPAGVHAPLIERAPAALVRLLCPRHATIVLAGALGEVSPSPEVTCEGACRRSRREMSITLSSGPAGSALDAYSAAHTGVRRHDDRRIRKFVTMLCAGRAGGQPGASVTRYPQ